MRTLSCFLLRTWVGGQEWAVCSDSVAGSFAVLRSAISVKAAEKGGAEK